VYINEGRRVRAVDRFTARERWRWVSTSTPIFAMNPGDRSTPLVESMSLIHADGQRIFANVGATGLSESPGHTHLVCLDARRGIPVWECGFHALGGNDALAGLSPHGQCVVVDSLIITLARQITQQKLTACYAVALDASTGHPVWVRHVASAGDELVLSGMGGTNRPLSSLVVHRGAVLVHSSLGAVARLDAQDGRLRWLRRSAPASDQGEGGIAPWEMITPGVIEQRVITLSPDCEHVLALDWETGDTLEEIATDSPEGWGSPSYLVMDGAMVYSVGRDIRAFDPAQLRAPLWIFPDQPRPRTMTDDTAPPPIISPRLPIFDDFTGRVQVAGAMLVAPTTAGVMIVDAETGELARALDADGNGNPVAAGAQIVLASSSLVQSYMSFARAESMIREQLSQDPADPGPTLSLLQLGLRAGRLDLALEAGRWAERAIHQLPEGEGRESARAAAFRLLLELNSAGLIKDQADASSVFPLAGRLARSATDRVEQALAWSDWYAPRDAAHAIEILHGILTDPQLAAAEHAVDDQLRAGSAWAIDRLLVLGRRGGPAAMAPQETLAAARLAVLDDSDEGDLEALLEIAAHYPLTPSGTRAAIRAASLSEKQSGWRQATGILCSQWLIAPEPARSGLILGALADMCDRAGRPEPIRSALDHAVALGLDVAIARGSGPASIVSHREDLNRRFPPRTPVALGPRGADIDVLPGVLLRETWSRRSGRRETLLVDGLTLRKYSAGHMDADWAIELEDIGTELLDHDEALDTLLLWLPGHASEISGLPMDGRLAAIDRVTGRERWMTPALAEIVPVPLLAAGIGNEAMPDGREFDARDTIPLADDERGALVRRSGGVAVFDRATGALLWSVERTLDRVHSARLLDVGLVLSGLERVSGGGFEPRVLVLDLDHRGGVRSRLRPQCGRELNWTDIDGLGRFVCAGEDGVELFDLHDGRRRWVNSAMGLSNSTGGVIGEISTLVEDRTGRPRVIRLADGFSEGAVASPPLGDLALEHPEYMSAEGTEFVLRFGRRLVRYDATGEVIGADSVLEDRNYLVAARTRDYFHTLSLVASDQVRIAPDAPSQTQRLYRIYAFSSNGRLEYEPTELPPLVKKIRAVRALEGVLLLSTDTETLAVPFPMP